jgi:alkanesulfonate monooxygenase SsuD/methylene tetrahydromethanopterin reductase-like flavin-dependent oxidoreductase (luciferase family)
VSAHAAGRIRLGWLADQRMAWPDLVDRGRHVEDFGYDGVWLSDHLAGEAGQRILDAWTALAGIIACVPRLEAGTLVASNGLRPPLLTVHMAMTLTDMAPGRFVLGLGAGGSRSEHLQVGMPFAPLQDRARELQYTCELVRSDTHRPPPLLVGGASPEILKVAARYADRWTIWGSPSELAGTGSMLDRFAFDAGRHPTAIRHGAIVMVIPDHLPERPSDEVWPAELRGDEAAIADGLTAYSRAGVSDLIVCDYAVEPPHRHAMLAWLASVRDRLPASARPGEGALW